MAGWGEDGGMNIIEKLEALLNANRFALVNDDCTTTDIIAVSDIRAIIEEYKATEQEPVAYIHRNEHNEYRLEPKDDFKIAAFPMNVDVDLFTHTQLSDETVKDAARWNKLIGYVGAQKTEWGGQIFHLASLPIPDGVNLMQGGVSGHLTKIIDEAMKAKS